MSSLMGSEGKVCAVSILGEVAASGGVVGDEVPLFTITTAEHVSSLLTVSWACVCSSLAVLTLLVKVCSSVTRRKSESNKNLCSKNNSFKTLTDLIRFRLTSGKQFKT